MVNKKNQKRNNCWVGISLIMITILIVGGIIYYKMPKQVCHDEYEIEKYVVQDCNNNLIYISSTYTEYSYESEILCEEGVDVGEYDALDKKVIYGSCYSDANKVCLIKRVNEVCEVVYK